MKAAKLLKSLMTRSLERTTHGMNSNHYQELKAAAWFHIVLILFSQNVGQDWLK